MIKSFIKAAAAVAAVFAFVFVISLYDSEKFAEPIIGYSEAVTQIPLDSMWQENEPIPETQAVATVSSSVITQQEAYISDTVTAEQQTHISEVPAETAEPNGLININTATADELKQLNGIGDVIAARIVEYAQTVGFKTIEDIKNVKGIGDKKFENIKDKITV